MKRKIRKLLIIPIATIVVMAALFAAYYGFGIISTLRTDLGRHSDMSLLNAVIREELRTYFKREGHYPENLDVLKPTIVKNCYLTNEPDRPKELEMLTHFQYSSDGITYTIIWSHENKHDGTIYTHKEYGRNGILEKTELYINGQRRN